MHLGAPNYEASLVREQKIIRFLESVEKDAQAIFLVGDTFDFWFEYRHAVPRGYVRLLGKLAELADSGIKLHYFTGNHDMWVFDYLPSEIGLTIYREPVERVIGKRTFYIGHGDGLGPGDHGYKFIKKVFANKFCQWLFARLHPNFGIPLALYFSRKSRIATGTADEKFLGEENEWLIVYSKELLAKKHYDYLIFGHRHLPLDIKLGSESRYINLGEWINYNTYAVFDGDDISLLKFESETKA